MYLIKWHLFPSHGVSFLHRLPHLKAAGRLPAGGLWFIKTSFPDYLKAFNRRASVMRHAADRININQRFIHVHSRPPRLQSNKLNVLNRPWRWHCRLLKGRPGCVSPVLGCHIQSVCYWRSTLRPEVARGNRTRFIFASKNALKCHKHVLLSSPVWHHKLKKPCRDLLFSPF